MTMEVSIAKVGDAVMCKPITITNDGEIKVVYFQEYGIIMYIKTDGGNA
jgi:hypothetical protein